MWYSNCLIFKNTLLKLQGKLWSVGKFNFLSKKGFWIGFLHDSIRRMFQHVYKIIRIFKIIFLIKFQTMPSIEINKEIPKQFCLILQSH